MKRLSARLYTSPRYKVNDDIEVVIEFINETSQVLYIPKELSGAFQVGEKKRLAPRKGKTPVRKKAPAFFRVRANSSLLKKVNLGKQTGLTPGTHTIVFKPAGIHTKRGKTRLIQTPYKVKAIKADIIVVRRKTATKISALEVINTTDLLDLPGTAAITEATGPWPEGIARPVACRIIGGSPEQRAVMTTAHEDGYLLAFKALENLGNDNHYRRWFGVFDNARFQSVQNVFESVVRNFRNESLPFTYDITGNGCTTGVIGHTSPESKTIFFCKPFFNLVATGRSSRAGRIVHEHSHASGKTLDSAFSFNECLDTAIHFPLQAVRNASNFQFFAERA